MYSDYYHTAHFGVQLFFAIVTLVSLFLFLPTHFTVCKNTFQHEDLPLINIHTPTSRKIKQFVPLLWPFISTHILTLYPLTPSHVCITYVYPNLTSRQHAQLTDTEHKMKQYSSKTTSRSSFSFTSWNQWRFRDVLGTYEDIDFSTWFGLY